MGEQAQTTETAPVASAPAFGDRVIVKAVLRRRRQRTGTNCVRKYWQPEVLDTPRAGIVIGWRTLFDGECHLEDEVGYVFEPRNHMRASLVVFSDRENPVFAPTDAVEPVGG